jgi:hypothetical protein
MMLIQNRMQATATAVYARLREPESYRDLTHFTQTFRAFVHTNREKLKEAL